MKNIFKSLLFCCALALCIAPLTSCSKDDAENSGITGIKNPWAETPASEYGETATISFSAANAWDATLEMSDGGSWATIDEKKGNTAAGEGSIRMTFSQNNSGADRSVNVYVTVSGHDRTLLCKIKQPGGTTSPEMSRALNDYMHKELKANYLWHTDYAALETAGKIDLNGPYDEFLFTHLTKLGNTNIEDGGLFREYSINKGKRYIYSYLQEMSPASRASTKAGLGIGPTLSTALDDKGAVCLLIGYVYPGSPAEKAKLQRGDFIFSVNGTKLNMGNYATNQNALYYATSGTFVLKYYRWVKSSTGMTMVEMSTTISCANFAYNPMLMAATIDSKEGITPAYRIGYMVLESFDLASHDEVMVKTLQDFKANNITDLILDLRFNPGGALAEARYLLSAIAGSAHYDDAMANLTFNDGRKEKWTFGYGPNNQPNGDGLGQAPDLGLKRLFVICSENTGSASEVIINALKGIDFPITTYGSRTEGKNVGMAAKEITYKGRKFEFAPITFRIHNAKDFGDYADGFAVDKMVNNQNGIWGTDDIEAFFPYVPADWGDTNDLTLYWALINCIDGKDPDFSKSKSAGKSPFSTRTGASMPNTQIKPEMGRFGNLIYNDEVVKLGE